MGIDLGTTNTCAAYADGRIPRIIPTERGENLLSSAVGFHDDNVLLGQPAKERLLLHPEDTVVDHKRLLGRAFHTSKVKRLARHLAYPVVEGPDKNAAVHVGGKTRPLVDISALLLEQMRKYAGHHLDAEVAQTVISVPAYYPLRQRAAVKQAARQAGLGDVRLVNEPTAAALAYGLSRNVPQRVLVFDLGGGTFDVSVLEIDSGTFQVLATGGDGLLGGTDFDIALAEHLLNGFADDKGIDLRDDPQVVQRVLAAAEAAKCDLSMLRHTEVRLPFVAQRRGKPLELLSHVSRNQLEQLTYPLVERCMATVQSVLSEAGLQASDVDEVLLAGGQTRMPMLQSALAAHFDRPPRRGVHPDEVVAQGAALLARSLGTQDTLRLLDVLSLPIVARVQPEQGRRSPTPELLIVEKNRTLPEDGVVTIPTFVDNQEQITVELLQGQGAGGDTDYLGTVVIGSIPRGPAGTREARLEVHVDVEGDVRVRGAPGQATLQPLRLLTRPSVPFDQPPMTSPGDDDKDPLQRRSKLRRWWSRST